MKSSAKIDIENIVDRLCPVGIDPRAGRAGVYFSRCGVKLRAVPWALNGSTHHHAACERSSLVRTAIIESYKPLLSAAQDDTPPAGMDENHLVPFQIVDRAEF